MANKTLIEHANFECFIFLKSSTLWYKFYTTFYLTTNYYNLKVCKLLLNTINKLSSYIFSLNCLLVSLYTNFSYF